MEPSPSKRVLEDRRTGQARGRQAESRTVGLGGGKEIGTGRVSRPRGSVKAECAYNVPTGHHQDPSSQDASYNTNKSPSMSSQCLPSSPSA